jgi:hypothetical protein
MRAIMLNGPKWSIYKSPTVCLHLRQLQNLTIILQEVGGALLPVAKGRGGSLMTIATTS